MTQWSGVFNLVFTLMNSNRMNHSGHKTRLQRGLRVRLHIEVCVCVYTCACVCMCVCATILSVFPTASH